MSKKQADQAIANLTAALTEALTSPAPITPAAVDQVENLAWQAHAEVHHPQDGPNTCPTHRA